MKTLFGFCIFSIVLGPLAADEIVNGQKPSGKPITLTFTEDLRFGADEDDDHYLWALNTTGLAVDKQGHMYVADTKESQILEFDAEGKFLRVLMPKGPGPGEVARLASFQILPDGRGIALESGPGTLPKFHFLDENLKFVEAKSPQGFGVFPISAVFAPDLSHFGSTFLSFDLNNGKMVTKTGVLNMEFQTVKEFSSQSQDVDFQNFANPEILSQFIIDLLRNAFRGVGVTAFDLKGNMYSAISTNYEITKWDPTLEKSLKVIKRDCKVLPNTQPNIDAIVERVLESFRLAPGLEQLITPAFVEKVKQKAELPPTKNPVNGFVLMEDGAFLVVHDVNAATNEQTADIFNPDGKYVGQVSMPNAVFLGPAGNPRMIFKNGFAYTVQTDENDENRVIRYRYERTKI